MSKEPTIDVILERLTTHIKYSKAAQDTHNDNLESVIEQLKILNGKVVKNTEYRIQTRAAVDIFKWLVGILGIGNIVLIIRMFTQ